MSIGGEAMLVRVGNAKDVTAGAMRVFDVAGTKVSVASARLALKSDFRILLNLKKNPQT